MTGSNNKELGPVSLELEPVSHSRLKGYQECPYRLKYEARGVPTSPQLIGNAVHKTIEAHLKEEDADEVMRNFITEMGLTMEASKDALALFETFKETERYKFDVNKIIAVENDDGETIHYNKPMFLVELPIEIVKRSGEKVRLALRGMMDLVFDRETFIEIWDWKTGYAVPDDSQSDFYAVAAYFKYYRPKKIVVRMALLRHGYATYKEYSEDDILEILNTLGSVAAGYLREEKWEPRINSNCHTCSLKKNCAPYLEALTIGADASGIVDDCKDYSKVENWVGT